MSDRAVPLLAWPLLLAPRRIQARLQQIAAAGLVHRVPTPWQVALGVARMWHRILFRSETIGTCSDFAVRDTWRARLLQLRPLRGPFLLARRAIAPWDHTGLLSSTERVRRHLLGAHHDGVQFLYDFELLRGEPGALEAVRDEARQVVDGTHPEAAWLRDLCVYERYHESLLEAVESYLADPDGAPLAVRSDPDLSFLGYLDWCAAQPPTPAATWPLVRAGRYRFPDGLPAG